MFLHTTPPTDGQSFRQKLENRFELLHFFTDLICSVFDFGDFSVSQHSSTHGYRVWIQSQFTCCTLPTNRIHITWHEKHFCIAFCIITCFIRVTYSINSYQSVIYFIKLFGTGERRPQRCQRRTHECVFKNCESKACCLENLAITTDFWLFTWYAMDILETCDNSRYGGVLSASRWNSKLMRLQILKGLAGELCWRHLPSIVSLFHDCGGFGACRSLFSDGSTAI